MMVTIFTICIIGMVVGAIIIAYFYTKRLPDVLSSLPPQQVIPPVTVQPVTIPPIIATTTVATIDPDAGPLYWDTPKHIYHAVRVMCDLAGLTVVQKNTLCECLYQESQFHNYEPDGTAVRFLNKDKNGSVWSTDWGLCQINDYYNIGPGKPFPSVDYVLANPDKVVAWMIKMYKQGQLTLWSSYETGAYKKWGLATSPMWLLGE